jgi:LDH2 family malate/lactate/ureidoglycolate dehydrogenase
LPCCATPSPIAGLSQEDAGIAADVAGYGTLHGAVQMPLYTPGLLDGTIKSRPSMVTSGSLTCCKVIDADNALGLVVGTRAMDIVIELTKEYGMGAVAVRNSSHFGGAGYLIAKRAA